VFVLAISALLLHSVDLQWGGTNPNPSQRLGHVPAMDGARNAKRGGGVHSLLLRLYLTFSRFGLGSLVLD